MKKTELVSYHGNGELVAYTTASQIAKAYPQLSDQLEYERGMKLLGNFTKDHAFYVAALEAQVALAQTLPRALKLGDVKAERKGSSTVYTVCKQNHALHGQTVTRWRGLAAVSKADRQQFYAENTRPTRAALLRWANPSEQFQDAGPLEANKVYGVLLADPPWRYEHSKTNSRKVENQYPTMSADELASLSAPAAANCTLFMWATNPKLVECIDLIESWGFEYKTNVVWVKDKVGMGYWARQQHELLLIATMGTVRPPSDKIRQSSIIRGERLKHSQKPESAYEMIEAYFPKASKYEMFARNNRVGWVSWGNET